MQTRWLWLVVLLVTLSGCMHWANVSSLDDAAGACRVRITANDRPPVILERPTVDEIRDLVTDARGARVQVRKVNAWATALIATGGFLATAFTGLVILGLAAVGIAGG